MTAPYLPDAEAVLAESHGQVARARATHPDFDAPVELDVTAANLTFDEQHAPRASATLTAVVPDDPALLDPRLGVRVEIDAGYVRPGGIEDVHTIADLGLREVTTTRPTSTVRLGCAGDEMLVIDGSPAVGMPIVAATHSSAIQTLIKQTVYPAPEFVVDVLGGAVSEDPMTDRWATIQDLADRMEAKVYDDGLRTFHITPTPVRADTPDLTLTVGEHGTVLDSDATLARDPWFNYAQLRYRWRDATDVDRQVIATAYVSDGPYAVTGPAGKRIFLQDREVPTNQTNANAAVRSVLGRLLSRSQTYRVRAIAAYWLRPGMTVALRLTPAAEPVRHLVQRVDFDLVAGTMTVDTRQPDLASGVATTTPGPAIPTDPPPPKQPDPEPPAKTTYVSEWVASSSRSYQGDGGENTFISPEIAQGYFGSTNGNQSAIVLFTGANSTPAPGKTGHTGQTITQALTGATVSKLEVRLYADHWYSFAGGTGRVGYYDGVALPATFKAARPYKTEKYWKRDTWRWVNLTSSAFIRDLLDGSARGITVGPGLGTDQHYYGRFDGAGATNKPRLRITYAK